MFVFRKEELKEDKNEAKIGAEWWLIRHKDSSSFYLPFIVFKWTLVLFCKDISNLFRSQEVVLACFRKHVWIESVRLNKTCSSAVRSIMYIIQGDKINIEMNAGNKLNVRRRENMGKVSSKLKTDPWLISPWSNFQFSRSMQTWSSKSDKNCSQVQGMIT